MFITEKSIPNRLISSAKMKEDLGQVFTPENVARLMSLLLLGDKKNGRILDPCVGDNVFLRTIDNLFSKNNFLLNGVEVDESLIDYSFYYKKNREIFTGNFFKYFPNHQYDYIIMNPPYVRQEQLCVSKVNDKYLLNSVVGDVPFKFNGQTNLYVYFFIKALKQLKPGGRMVAICYDSWLYTKYGEDFKNYLNQNSDIKKIIHFKKSAFKNANIGATIIELEKTTKRSTPLKIAIEDASTIPFLKNIKELKNFLKQTETSNDDVGFDFSDSLFEDIGARFLDVRRGLETPANEFFYVPENIKSNLVKPVIKDIKRIKDYRVFEKNTRRVLLISEKKLSNIEKKVKDYLLGVKKSVINSGDKYKNLKKSIEENGNWFVVKEVAPGNIVFNYYFRDKTNFIYNPSKYFVSNNFYTMNSTDAFVDLAILNSSFTRASIALNARTQGRGLKKLQLYEFKKVRMFRKELLPESELKKVRKYGKELCSSKAGQDKNLIKKVDMVLLNFLNKTTGKNITYENVIKYRLLN